MCDYIFYRSTSGHLRDEFKPYFKDLHQNGYDNFYFRNYLISEKQFSKAQMLFSQDRHLNVEQAGVKKYKGPNFDARSFNCHKYATKFLVRIGILDGFLFQFDYPSAVNKDSSYFQHIKLLFHPGHTKPVIHEKPKIFYPEEMSYPESYYRMANRIIGRTYRHLDTTGKIRNYIAKALHKNLLPLIGIKVMSYYRKKNFNRIFHFRRHHTEKADKIIRDMRSCIHLCCSQNSTAPFAQIINNSVTNLPLEVINTNGSFFRRLLFLKEITP
ncbi:MAG: hypothetical protein GY750_14590 [Lentisphaerae bacterium]|nr:hypothetical protein [Lentisphaerota bacterium]MCP4102630.1 hypothetical protein [Lentisphaerota bacterium]